MYSNSEELINEILRNGFMNTSMYNIDDRHMINCVLEAYKQVDINIAPEFKNELKLEINRLLEKIKKQKSLQ